MEDTSIAIVVGIIFVSTVLIGFLVSGRKNFPFPSDNTFEVGDTVYYLNPEGYKIYGIIKGKNESKRRVVSPSGVGNISIWIDVKYLNK
jgi:hypothetical protein